MVKVSQSLGYPLDFVTVPADRLSTLVRGIAMFTYIASYSKLALRNKSNGLPPLSQLSG